MGHLPFSSVDFSLRERESIVQSPYFHLRFRFFSFHRESHYLHMVANISTIPRRVNSSGEGEVEGVVFVCFSLFLREMEIIVLLFVLISASFEIPDSWVILSSERSSVIGPTKIPRAFW